MLTFSLMHARRGRRESVSGQGKRQRGEIKALERRLPGYSLKGKKVKEGLLWLDCGYCEVMSRVKVESIVASSLTLSGVLIWYDSQKYG